MSKINIAIAITILLVLTVGFLLLKDRVLENKLRDLRLLPETESFTELYFSNHETLPYTIAANKEVSFEFTIHNLENKDMEYPYEIFLTIDKKKQLLVKNSVFVKNNEQKSVKETISANYPSKKFKIGVNLTDKNQAIDFWVQE